VNASLGLESGTVRVVPHDARWAVLFAQEAQRIRDALAARDLTLAIEHMGSTAVPGLSAKPIVDLLAGWDRVEELPRLIAALRDAGYIHRGEQGIPGREFFRRGDPRQYHLHLAQFGGPFWRDHLAFRDLLRADAGIAGAYDALKHMLAEKYPRDREAYIDGKTKFVQDMLERARERGMYRDVASFLQPKR
jgi:GrpB-like predicted nucleotidyltransferase (UPF0157 family)